MSKDALTELKNIETELKEISGHFSIEFPLSSLSKQKVESLKKNGRNFFEETNVMENKVAKFVDEELTRNPEILTSDNLSDKILELIAISVKDIVIQRFENNGGDISLRSLSASTIKEKGNNRIGIDSGDLLSEIKRIKPKITNL